MNEIKQRKIVLFFVITFAFSWILWTPFVLAGLGVYEMTETLNGLVMPAIILGAFGPLFAAMVLLFRSGGMQAVKRFFQESLDFRIQPIYYVLAVVFPIIVVVIAHYFTNLTGLDTLPDNLFPEELGVSPLVLVIPYFLLMLLFGGGQEEFGWRGYVLNPLQDKFGILKASIILGIMWGLWHFPLWLIPGEGHEYYSFFAFLLFTTSFSVMIGILYNASGKKMVIPWVIHGMSNTIIPFFPVLFLEDVPQPGYWVFVVCNILVASGLAFWYFRTKKTTVST
ncbi:MAG: CPBP family intramembrane metalloprotease [Firmicutes bacterium]|nr:CPBP family intramembrane metalloprotease [Bacillota bacterium]